MASEPQTTEPVGVQCMLFGAVNGEIVVEVEIPRSMIIAMPVSTELAKAILAEVGWRTDFEPDEWWIERQPLYTFKRMPGGVNND